MKKKSLFVLLMMTALVVSAQSVKLKGIAHDNRYKANGELCQMEHTWIGSLLDDNGEYVLDSKGNVVTAYITERGIYSMEWDGSALSAPVKDPSVSMSDIKQNGKVDVEKAIWATNFNLMYANSGACYVDGQLVTVMSRDEQSTVDEELFAVRKWDAATGNLLSNEIRPKSDRLESAGMAYNPVDGKVYGLFYLTGQQLPAEITGDPEYFTDQDDDMTDGDAGYCLCTVDLQTMTVTPITPGLYYYNFITFAINSEGRAFALTSGGARGAEDADGRMRDINNNLTGAQLCEFDLATGMMKMEARQTTDPATNETITEYVHPVGATGYCSKYKRQSACFAKSNPNKMYWSGYCNSGKGINSYGSWGELPDKEWESNGKYDTALYEVDITTGIATRLAKFDKRWIFSALWVDGDDSSDGSGTLVTGIKEVKTAKTADSNDIYDLQGRRLAEGQLSKGLYIINGKKVVR